MKDTTTKQPRRAPAKPRPQSRRRPAGGLSKRQIIAIATEAKKAFEAQLDLGLIEIPAGTSRSAAERAWRHEQQQHAIGIASLGHAENRHYRPLRAHFLHLQGRDAEAFETHVRSGRVKDTSPAGDTHEARETWRHKILRELEAHAARMERDGRGDEIITAAYIDAIARAKHGPRLHLLTAEQLKQLYYTLRNRVHAREGRGDTTRRNKSQRRTPHS